MSHHGPGFANTQVSILFYPKDGIARPSVSGDVLREDDVLLGL